MAKKQGGVVKLGGNMRLSSGINEQPKEGLRRKLWLVVSDLIGKFKR